MSIISFVNRPALRFLAALPLLLGVTGCSSELDIPEFFEVTYTIRNDSLGSITEFTFIDDLDQTNVLVPEGNELSTLYLKPKGQRIAASAEATVWDGEVVLTIEVVGLSKSFTRTQSCEDMSGQELPCSLEIPVEIL